jgi:thioredoxin reductase (NADPH)
LHRGAVRALLVAMDEHHTRIPFSEIETLRRATALGRIDFWVVKGWVTPEEWLYPTVQEALSAWTTANRSRHVVYRIVGERWDPRTYALRDMLTRNSVPFEFCPVDSGQGAELVGDPRPGGPRRGTGWARGGGLRGLRGQALPLQGIAPWL